MIKCVKFGFIFVIIGPKLENSSEEIQKLRGTKIGQSSHLPLDGTIRWSI